MDFDPVAVNIRKASLERLKVFVQEYGHMIGSPQKNRFKNEVSVSRLYHPEKV